MTTGGKIFPGAPQTSCPLIQWKRTGSSEASMAKNTERELETSYIVHSNNVSNIATSVKVNVTASSSGGLKGGLHIPFKIGFVVSGLPCVPLRSQYYIPNDVSNIDPNIRSEAQDVLRGWGLIMIDYSWPGSYVMPAVTHHSLLTLQLNPLCASHYH